ncbi:hypothetical protein D3C86_1286190 [compost metagenome]
MSFGPVDLVGEYARLMTDGGTFTANGVSTAIPTGMEGWYLESRYHFFPEFLNSTVLGKANGFERASFTLVGRYGQADTDLQASGANSQHELLVGLNYRPIPTFVTKLEWQRIVSPTSGRNDDAIWSSVAVGF